MNRKTRLSSVEKAVMVSVYGAIAAATVLGFAASVYMGNNYSVLAGLGVVAYVLGLRHGVDADHIAAIDNTTRKLMHEGKRPLTVGTWFSLGHSTIVFGLVVALTVATREVVSSIPTLRSMGLVLGTLVSGAFLFIIGLINVVIVWQIYGIFRGLKENKLDGPQLEEALNNRGLMNRYFGRLFKIVEKPWQIYPIGVLFGLGFDTASEVALIAISVGVGATMSVPVWMILVLPLMFTCGMVLVDTSDGMSMLFVYGWAFLNPIRKVYYNLTVTVISVLVAFLIGGVELGQAISGELHLGGAFWGWVNGLDFETLGYGVVALFVLSWLVSISYYRYRGFEKLASAATKSSN
jgi:high-affinity nickel-transport protein